MLPLHVAPPALRKVLMVSRRDYGHVPGSDEFFFAKQSVINFFSIVGWSIMFFGSENTEEGVKTLIGREC
jgi:hypothetical protein